MALSERGRPLCKEDVCGVEISATKQFCSGHEYMLKRWLEKSRTLLEKIKRVSIEGDLR